MATPPPADEDDEKTTIESGGWEEEASTTVEQGDVADKVRALGLGVDPQARPNTSITSTNGHGMSDEPTIDEQRAHVAITQIAPPIVARLVITQGNDAGQAIEVRPGKAYTIGRALDNDLVLTDMTVSRKHFDLRHDNDAWVLADRGSGNGTLVNTRLEDAPFTLANGDVIEIGNTTFRFELPNGVPRIVTGDPQVDDDEHSTTSGKPFHDPEPATPGQLITSVSRPKTLPPPAPRPRSSTNRPVPAYAPDRPSPQPLGHPPVSSSVLAVATAPTISPVQGLALHQPPPSTTLPLPQMANRPPLQPSALLDMPGAPGSPLGAMPATIPGQGPPMHPAHPARLPFSYPGAPEMPKLQPRGTARAIAVASTQAPRDATSTAQVHPISYSGGPALAQRHYTPPPELSRRTKMVLAGAGLALFAAIATIAIVKGAGSDGMPAPGHGPLAPAMAPPVVTPIAAPSPTRTITPIEPADEAPRAAARPVTASEPPSKPSPTAPPASTTTAAGPMTPEPATTPPASTASTTAATTPEPASSASAPATTAKPVPLATTTPPTKPATAPSSDPDPPAAVAPSTPSIARTEKAQTTAPPRSDRRPVRRPERKPEKRPEKRTAAKVEATRAEPARDRPAATEPRSGRSLQEVKNTARVQYQAKNFSAAAEHLMRSLSSFSGGDAQELKALANIYSQLGRSYNLGMGPATKHTEAYEHLRRALDYDDDLDGAYVGDIKKRLLDVAPRAAMKYMADKSFERAFDAASTAEKLGSTSASIQLVREKLQAHAADLLKAAQSELSTNPAEARQKARRIQGMVDPRHPLYVKASRLLDAP